MELTRLEPAARVGDQVFEAIHDAILSGAFAAGRRLQIRPLADELGTSVMPVREAIKRLEQIGLVEAAPYRGAIVKEFTARELLESYEVRKLLEVEAARLGAAAAGPAEVARLRELRAAMADALVDSRIADYLDADEALLSSLYAGAANAVLTETIAGLWVRCRSFKILGVRRELAAGRPDVLLVHQDRLVEAAQTRDGALAARITTESLDAAIARIHRALPAPEAL